MKRDRGPWIQTYTGIKFYPLDPKPEEVVIEDIAHALSRICRYGGQPSMHYSVAEHSVLVSHLVLPRYALDGLMHDAAEAYVGDVLRPIKRLPMFDAYVNAEANVFEAIAKKFGLHTDEATHDAVKEWDDRILVDEVKAVACNPQMYLEPGEYMYTLKPTGATIRGLDYVTAKAEFLNRFADLNR